MKFLPGRSRGFTLLELILAVTILTLFVLPILEIIAASRARAVKYTRDRVAQDLAYRKLFDRMYSVELQDSGTFEAEGYPDWTWEVSLNTTRGMAEEMPILEYTIHVTSPRPLNSWRPEVEGGEGGASCELTAWTFPSQDWLQEQRYLQSMGYENMLDGYLDPYAGGGYVGR